MMTQEIFKKWLPITRTLSNDIDMCKEMALYAEHHCSLELKMNYGMSTLAPSLKIMSKLKNLKGKKIIYKTETVQQYCSRIKYTTEEVQESKGFGVDLISQCENLIVEDIVKKLDANIFGCTEVHIHKLVKTIFTKTEMNDVYINFISDVIAKGNRKDKLRRILK